MASGSIIRDIDEQFLQCPICMDQLKEPKILPCLHRFCQGCLAGTVPGKARDVQCPTCREIHTLPANGIGGLKTDFNTKNIVEFVQSQYSVKQATKKGAPQVDGPMCHSHPGKRLELICTSCGNLPICVSCMFGVHKGHDVQEISSLAKIEKEKLVKKLNELKHYEEKIYKRQEEMKAVNRKLNRAVNAKKEELQEELDLNENKIKRGIREINDKLDQRRKELDKILGRKISQRKQQLDRDMRAANEKYDKYCKEERENTRREFEKLQRENKKDSKELRRKLGEMNKGIKDLLTSLRMKEKENTKKIKELSDHVDDIVSRFESLTSTASSVLVAKDDWTYVQCSHDLCTEIDSFIEEAKRELPDLQTLSNITVEGPSSAITGRRVLRVNITEQIESVVEIEGVTGRGWTIDYITGNEDGGIVLTGEASSYHSHITVINLGGKKVRQDIYTSSTTYGSRFCDFLSQHKIATAGWRNELGVYDIRDGTYTKANICDLTHRWPPERHVACIAADAGKDHIIVGGLNSRDVYVFNSQLEYIHTLTLPGIMKCPCDITVQDGNLLVCDNKARKACVVTMGGPACRLVNVFTEPDVGGDYFTPTSVCTDRNGFVYIMWEWKIPSKCRYVLVQYSRDCQELVQTRVIEGENDPYFITAVVINQGEKILVATEETGKLITYGLVESEI